MFEVVLLSVLCGALILVLLQNAKLQVALKTSQDEAKKVSIDLVKQEYQGQNTETLIKELNQAKQDLKLTNNKVIFQECENNSLVESASELLEEVARLNQELEQEKVNNQNILHQKKSSEVKNGLITEQLVPFLSGFNYDPTLVRFLGSPIDLIAFDLYSASPALVFVEVKTGNSQLSNTQKLIKRLIQKGCVRFEEFRVNEKGIKVKTASNEEEPTNE